MGMVALPNCHVTLRAVKPQPAAFPQALTTLGDWIRKTRLDLGLFQLQVAGRFGVDESTIVNWELNRGQPEIRYIPMIIEFIGYCPYIPTRSLTRRLEAVRWALGLTRRQLAAMLHTDVSTLDSWARGAHAPTARSQSRIQSFLDSAAAWDIRLNGNVDDGECAAP